MVPDPDRRRRKVILAACALSLFIVSLDNTVVNVALPAIRRDLHASVTGLQWIVDAYPLVLASLLMLAGTTADRVGRRRVFQTGLALFAAGSLLCALAPGSGWLIAFRMVQAAGGSMLNPVALSILRNTFREPAERARAIGVWGSASGLSLAMGPPIGGLLVDLVGWRAIFLVNLPIALAALVLAQVFLPESRAERPRRVDPIGQVLVVLALATLTYAIIDGPRSGWASGTVLGCLLVSGTAAAALLVYERNRVEPLVDLAVFRHVPFAAVALTAVCAFASLGGFLFLTGQYLQDARGVSGLRAGLLLLPMAASAAVAAPISGRLLAARGPQPSLLLAGLAVAASGGLLSALTVNTGGAVLAVAFVLFGLGFGLVNPPINNVALSGLPASRAGEAAGLLSTARQVGQVLGVAVAGSALASMMTGRTAADLATASHGGWWMVICCGALMVQLSVLTLRPSLPISEAAVPAFSGSSGGARSVSGGRALRGRRSFSGGRRRRDEAVLTTRNPEPLVEAVWPDEPAWPADDPADLAPASAPTSSVPASGSVSGSVSGSPVSGSLAPVSAPPVSGSPVSGSLAPVPGPPVGAGPAWRDDPAVPEESWPTSATGEQVAAVHYDAEALWPRAGSGDLHRDHTATVGSDDGVADALWTRAGAPAPDSDAAEAAWPVAGVPTAEGDAAGAAWRVGVPAADGEGAGAAWPVAGATESLDALWQRSGSAGPDTSDEPAVPAGAWPPGAPDESVVPELAWSPVDAPDAGPDESVVPQLAWAADAPPDASAPSGARHAAEPAVPVALGWPDEPVPVDEQARVVRHRAARPPAERPGTQTGARHHLAATGRPPLWRAAAGTVWRGVTVPARRAIVIAFRPAFTRRLASRLDGRHRWTEGWSMELNRLRSRALRRLRRGAVTERQLVAELATLAPHAWTVIQDLERQGLVERWGDADDSGAWLVALPQGRRLPPSR